MRKIVHLIPYRSIGGVEVAAETSADIGNDNFTFAIQFIYANDVSEGKRIKTYNPLYLLKCIVSLLKKKPDVLITSLWRAAFVGLFVKLLRSDTKLILFIHNTKDSHFLDYAVTRLTGLVADEVWSDSKSSLKERLPRYAGKSRVISFVTKKISPQPIKEVSPQFIFWGRISRQKNLAQALHIFRLIYEKIGTAKLTIIGPDGGQLSHLQQLCADLEIKDTVEFTGQKNFDEICQYAQHASFYLQTSLYEGMAMSVVESMQLGLVPVVTPVGQIAEYCKHDQNAVIIGSELQAVDSVLSVLKNELKYQKLARNAIKSWHNSLIYRDSFLSACQDALN